MHVLQIKNIIGLSFSLSLLFLVGCGLSEKPLAGQDLFVSQNLKSTCEIDPKVFEKFLTEPITEQIDCLQKNLEQYTHYVKRDDERYISYEELSRFAIKFFPSNKDKLSGSLKIFFRINTLFLNDPTNKLATEHIAPLFKLINLANKQAVILNTLLKEENRNRADRWHLRQEVADTMREFREIALSIMPQDNSRPNDLDLSVFVKELIDNLKTINFDLETAESLFFVKKVFLGGSANHINAGELRRLIDLSPEYTLFAFDALYLDEKQFNSQNDRLFFFSQRLEEAKPLLYAWPSEEGLFTKEQVLLAIKKLKLAQEIQDNTKSALDILKNYLLSKKNIAFTASDIKSLIGYGRVALEGMRAFNTFKEKSDLLTTTNNPSISTDFYKEIDKQISHIKEIIDLSQILPSSIALDKLLDEVNRSFKLNEGQETLSAILGIKKAFLGGSGNFLTDNEIKSFLVKASSLASLVFDAQYMDDLKFNSKNERLLFLSRRLEEARPLLFAGKNFSNDEIVFSKDQILSLIKRANLNQSIQENAEAGFDILKNYLLSGNTEGLSYKDVNTLLSYGRVALEAIQILNTFKEKTDSINPSNFLNESTLFYQEIDKQILHIKEIVESTGVLPASLRLDKLIEEANRSFKLNESPEILAAALGIKKILLGGNENILSDKEILILLSKASLLGSLTFDVTKITEKFFAKDYFYYDFLLPRLDKINALTNQNFAETESIIDIGDLLALVERFAPSLLVVRFKPSADALLKKIYNTDAPKLQYKPFKSILADARKALEIATYSATVYDLHADDLNKTAPIVASFPFVLQGSFRNIPNENLKNWHDNFNKVAMSYRFFQDENKLQYFGKEIHRFRANFIMTSLFRWGVRIIIDHYGRPDPTNPKAPYVGIADDLKAFMVDIKSILESQGLWTRKYATFSRNMLLLSDLFQFQSNGTLNCDEDELTEYVNLVFTAVTMNDNIYNDLLTVCPTSPTGIDDNIGFEQECVVTHYGEFFLEKNNYKQQLPLMNIYRGQISAEEFNNFIRNVVRFARENPETTPMDKHEVTLFTGALMNIESTYMRFDVNKDGVIDYQELEQAFKIYQKAIILVAKMTPAQEKYAFSVFLYMIKFMKIPTQTELAKFHYFGSKKTIVAKRLNIGAILYYLVQQANQDTPTN